MASLFLTSIQKLHTQRSDGPRDSSKVSGEKQNVTHIKRVIIIPVHLSPYEKNTVTFQSYFQDNLDLNLYVNMSDC